MKTSKDLLSLTTPEFRDSVGRHIADDPVRVALSAGAAVATQVKYLQRAKGKLPSWYAARCVIPPLAFEQSSSEACAAQLEWSGECAVDLTCGLGVDSLALSRRFKKVLSLERDPELARLARYNFGLLGADNIEVLNLSAEDFLRGAAGTENGTDVDEKALDRFGAADGIRFPVDLIYADPDRRGENDRKLVLLEECSPDMVTLMPLLLKLARRVAVKCSPLFDVDEAFRLFGPKCRVVVLSEGGECKQVLIELGEGIDSPVIRATALGIGSVEYPADEKAVGRRAPDTAAARESGQGAGPGPEAGGKACEGEVVASDFARYRWLITPDVAVQKARLVGRCFGGHKCFVTDENGYVFAEERWWDGGNVLMGRAFEIESIEPYHPKTLKKRLKEKGVKSLTIFRRNFPLANAQIAAQLGVKEGGRAGAAFTRVGEKLLAVFLKGI